MDIFVIDTNIFFNMEASLGMGDTTKDIMVNLTRACKNAKNEITLMIPPSIRDEISGFFENPNESLLLDFYARIEVKSPDYARVSLDSGVLCGLVEEYRARGYRGMKIAEEEIIRCASQFMGKEQLVQKEFQIATGKIITGFRDRYRNATRAGTIDSSADMDLILLAKELSAHLVSTDTGVLTWARKMGVKEMESCVFGKKMQAYL